MALLLLQRLLRAVTKENGIIDQKEQVG